MSDLDYTGCIGPTVRLSTGHYLDSLRPSCESFEVRDIVLGLASLSRYSGQYEGDRYTVAEHSIRACLESLTRHPDDPELAICCLLHDAHEGLMGCDLPRPIKLQLPDFRAMEARFAGAVQRRYGLTLHHDPRLHAIDRDLLFAERDELGLRHPGEPAWTGEREACHVSIPPRRLNFKHAVQSLEIAMEVMLSSRLGGTLWSVMPTWWHEGGLLSRGVA